VKLREYCFLKKLYNISPEVNENHNYKHHFINDIIEPIGKDEKSILALSKRLEEIGYVLLLDNIKGHVYTVAITHPGVYAITHYYRDIVGKIVWSILIPAVVSVICSLIVISVGG
jgi:hypothetical protein